MVRNDVTLNVTFNDPDRLPGPLWAGTDRFPPEGRLHSAKCSCVKLDDQRSWHRSASVSQATRAGSTPASAPWSFLFRCGARQSLAPMGAKSPGPPSGRQGAASDRARSGDRLWSRAGRGDGEAGQHWRRPAATL